ncbi:MAG TPA: PilZ domain-containing protein, partial [Thermoleophilaceae bacterium]
MRRLREHQFVTMEVDRPNASIECLVLAIDGNEATLEPVDLGQMALLGSAGSVALLTFEYRSQLISLRGTARRDEIARDLRFAVTDKVMVPQRRRYARVESAVPLTLVPLAEQDGNAVAGAPIETRTRDISADGVLAEELLPPSDQRWRATLELPDNGPPIICEAITVRNVGGGTAMRYTAIRAEDRQRLKQFVAARKRAVLAKLRN